MYRTFAIILLFAGCVSGAQGQTARQLMNEWETSWNTYDLNDVRRIFVNDSTVTYFSSERPGLIRGIDSLVQHHKRFGFAPGGKQSINRLWLTGLRYLPSAVTATWHFQRPNAEVQQGPVTFILKKETAGFRIAHAHFSNDPKPK